MDSFEMNKIMGAILGTCLGVLSLNITANAIFHPVKPAQPGYKIDVPDKAKPGEKAAPEKEVPFEQLLANADVARGKAAANQCIACHTFDKGGKSGVGPNLYDIVGRAKGSLAGYNYSAAMKKVGGNWTLQGLADFAKNPKAVVPGTSMTYAGMTRAAQLADLIAYLNSQSDKPHPLKAAQAPAGK